jgi:phosphoribosylaminoimidazole carboxylase (NCAIR synthetase)
MYIKVNEVAPRVTQRYPYTHRAEFQTSLTQYEQILDWILNLNIGCVTIPLGNNSHALYLRKNDLTMFILRWS